MSDIKLNSGPGFVAQVEQTPFSHPEWFKKTRDEAESKGFKHFRFSIHPINMDLALIEGWVQQPECEGSQRWSLNAIFKEK